MKTRHEVLLLLLTCLLLGLAGCGGKAAEDMIEDTIGGLMDAENDAVLEEAIKHRTFSDDDDSVKVMSSKWPKEIPGEYVEFDYGTHLQTVMHNEDGNWSIIYTATMDEIEDYEKDLTKAGWVNDESYNDVPSVLSYDWGKRNTSVVIGEHDNNIYFVTIYLDHGDDLKEDQGMLEEGFVIEAEDASHEIGAKIPDRYPHELCPIYEPSEVSIAIESEDEEFIGYTIGLLTMDEIEIVKKFYLDHNPQSRSDMGLMAVYVFEAENGEDYASVTVMENQDEADKEFETSITISVALSK